MYCKNLKMYELMYCECLQEKNLITLLPPNSMRETVASSSLFCFSTAFIFSFVVGDDDDDDVEEDSPSWRCANSHFVMRENNSSDVFSSRK